jgi:hypothetical protein
MSKEKINNSTSMSVRTVNAHLDDLRYIEGLLRDELKGEDYAIEYNGYRYGSLEDVLQDKPTKNEIKFKVYNPLISVEISKSGVDIRSIDSTFTTEGVLSNIHSYFENKRTTGQRFGDWFEKAVPAAIPLIFIPFSLDLIGIFERGLLVSLLLVMLVSLALLWQVGRTSKIYYTEKAPNFFKRHKDTIIINIIVAVISVGLTKLLGA